MSMQTDVRLRPTAQDLEGPVADGPRPNAKPRSLSSMAWARLRRNKTAVVGFMMLGAILLACLCAPLYIDYEQDVIGIDFLQRLKYPAEGKLLGTDELGRDIFARIIWGGRISLKIGIGAVVLAAVVATTLGTAAAYYGGRLDNVIMRALDVVMAIPSMLLMITFVAIMDPTHTNLMVAIGAGFVPGMARLVRAQVMAVRDAEFVRAATALGASEWRIVFRHILPNAIGPIISSFVLNVPGAVMTISALSFIGLGVQPPDPEWGAMLASGRQYIRDAWHIAAFPGAAIMLTVVALTLVGDGLRDAFDPRMNE